MGSWDKTFPGSSNRVTVLVRGSMLNVSIWEGGRFQREKHLVCSVCLHLLLFTINTTVFWNVILGNIKLKQSHLHCHQWWHATVGGVHAFQHLSHEGSRVVPFSLGWVFMPALWGSEKDKTVCMFPPNQFQIASPGLPPPHLGSHIM